MEHKRFGLQLFFLLTSVLILSMSMLVVLAFLRPSPRAPHEPVACTQEAKICPDGTAVGRTGPRCEFAPCQNAPNANFGVPVSFAVGISKTFADGLTLTLKEINDSRCKPGTVCVWAGEISAVFQATGGAMGKSLKEIRLGTSNKKEITENNYVFTLQDATETAATITVSKRKLGSPESSCYVGGCSGEVCSDSPDAVSACIYKPEFVCYANAKCERQSDGVCGWTKTPELAGCLNMQ